MQRLNQRILPGFAALALAAGAVGCRGASPGDLAIDASDPDGLYAPEVVRAIDLMGHDDARCVRGWISRAIDAIQGRTVTPAPAAKTLREAAQQAMTQRWCLLEPAPDISKQLQGCIEMSQSVTEQHACHCQLVRPHMSFLHSAAGEPTTLPALTKGRLESGIQAQALNARCKLAAGTLERARACDADDASSQVRI